MEEAWASAFGWEGLYEVSSMGRVRSLKRTGGTPYGVREYGGKVLSPVKRANGYYAVNLTRKGSRRQELVHRLVLLSFLGPDTDKPVACHCDGVQSNNRLGNLRWDTTAGNMADKQKHGTSQRGERNGHSKLTRSAVDLIRTSLAPTAYLASQLGVSGSCIRAAKSGATWA